MLFRCIILIGLLAGISQAFAAPAGKSVLLVQSSGRAAYREMAADFARFLGQRKQMNVTIRKIVLADGDPPLSFLTKTSAYDLILTIGTRAAENVLSLGVRTPIVATFLPKPIYLNLLQSETRRFNTEFGVFRSAVYMEQPLSRQVMLANIIHSGAYLDGKPARELEGNSGESEQCDWSDSYHHSVVFHEDVTVKTIPSLLDNTGIAIATPLFIKRMADNAKWLLYMAYQRNIPVVGYSEAFVKAGAIASVFSAPQNIAEEAADVVEQFFKMARYESLPPRYSHYFSVKVNKRVSESLGYYQLEDEALLKLLINTEVVCGGNERDRTREPKQRMTQLEKGDQKSNAIP